MLVLVDIEWIHLDTDFSFLTQISAVRVDSAWTVVNRFDSLVQPPYAVSFFNSNHMAFSGHPRENFDFAFEMKDVLQQFEEWLLPNDTLCFWANPILTAMRSFLSQASPSMPELPAITVNNFIRSFFFPDEAGEIHNLYRVAEKLSLGNDRTAHRSSDDVDTLREILQKTDLPPKQLIRKIEYAPYRETMIKRRKHNAEVLLKIENDFVYTSGRSTYHLKTCPHVLNAKTILGISSFSNNITSMQPCKICKPKIEPPKEFSFSTAEPFWDTPSGKDKIRVRLITGQVIVTHYNRIIGCCHSTLHPGKLTQKELTEHECLKKQCSRLEKYLDVPFWKELENKERKKQKQKDRKQQEKHIKKKQENRMQSLLAQYQSYAAKNQYPIDIIRVKVEEKEITVFYVSDYRFADALKFPEFVRKIKENSPGHNLILRHIKDENGNFMTREEYHKLKR